MAHNVMSEETLEQLCNLYIDNNIKEKGYTLEQFLENHRAIIATIVFDKPAPLPADQEFYPLLPEQRRVMDHLDREESFNLMAEEFEARMERQTSKDVMLRMSNGCMKESMHHRHYPNAGKVQHKK